MKIVSLPPQKEIVELGTMTGTSIVTPIALNKLIPKVEQLAGKWGKIAKWGTLIASAIVELVALAKTYGLPKAGVTGVTIGTLGFVVKEALEDLGVKL